MLTEARPISVFIFLEDLLTISLVVKALWALCSSVFSPVPTLHSNLCLFPNVLQTSGWPKELWLPPSPRDASLQVALGDPLTSCGLLRRTDHWATPSFLYPAILQTRRASRTARWCRTRAAGLRQKAGNRSFNKMVAERESCQPAQPQAKSGQIFITSREGGPGSQPRAQ